MNSKVSSPSSAYSTTGGTVTVYTTTASSMTYNVTVPSGGYVLNSNGTGASWSTITSSNTQPSLTVTGSANIEGELKVGGKDIAKSLEAIEKRLSILTPDPSKLEKFEALKKAYEHYKLMEALCYEDKKDE